MVMVTSAVDRVYTSLPREPLGNNSRAYKDRCGINYEAGQWGRPMAKALGSIKSKRYRVQVLVLMSTNCENELLAYNSELIQLQQALSAQVEQEIWRGKILETNKTEL